MSTRDETDETNDVADGEADDRASERDASVFERERPRLVGVAYRMLGDVAASEDIVQDAFVRWSTRRDEPVRNPAAYLTTIVTRLAIDRLTSAASRRETYVGQWLAEPILFDPAQHPIGPDEAAVLAESVTLGFLAMLDALTPVERAVFLLHDVFDLSFGEIAATVDKAEPACRKIASRARAKIAAHRSPSRPRAVSARDLDLVAAFGAALATADFEAATALLTSEAVMTADGGGVKAAAIRPVVGADRVARFFIGVAKKLPADANPEFAMVNGEPAVIMVVGDEIDAVVTFGIADDRIDHLHVVRNPHKLGALTRRYRLDV